MIECETPLGRICCFKPIDQDSIYFSHMAGKVIDDFGDMALKYVLKCNGKYYFWAKVVIKSSDVQTSKEAKRNF